MGPAALDDQPKRAAPAFVLPPDDAQSSSVAASIAFDPGRQMQRALAGLLAVFGDQVPAQVRQTRDLFIVGSASKLPILHELQPSLPAPFEADSDLATELNAPGQYRRTQAGNGVLSGHLAADREQGRACALVMKRNVANAGQPWEPRLTPNAMRELTELGRAARPTCLRAPFAGRFSQWRFSWS